MKNLQFNQQFAQEFKTTAELITGHAGNRIKRNASRIGIMAQTGQDWYEILLPGDLEESAFESSNFFHYLDALNVDDQKRLQRGNQFLSYWDGYPCVLIGSWARQCFTSDVLNLNAPMVYVMPFKFNRFFQFLQSPENIAKGINAVLSADGHSFTIESHWCTVIDGKSNQIMDDVMTTAMDQRLFNNKVLVSPDERLFDIH